VTWTATHPHRSTTRSSPSCSTDRFLCSRRPSSLWFDDKCRGAKQKVQHLERATHREGPLALSMSLTAATWHVNVVHTSTNYTKSNTCAGPNASTTTSHTRVICGGPSMNCWVVVGLSQPTLMLQPFIDTLTTKLSECYFWCRSTIFHALHNRLHTPGFFSCHAGQC